MLILTIAVFYLLILGIGLWAGRKHGEADSVSDLILAGRQLPLFLGVLTMTATWVGGGYINGTAEAIYDSTQGIVWAQAPWGYAISMVLGGLFFARRMRREGYTTLLDPFERQYGRTAAAWLFLPALLGEIFWSAAILVALGTTFATILEVDARTAILVSAAVVISYTVVGGLWSVAWTDVVQIVFLILGLCLAVPFAVSRVGGLDAVVQASRTQMPAFPTGNDVWLWLDMALLLCLGGIPWQVYFQRVLAARDERTAMQLSLVAACGCLLMALPAALIGAVGIAADWSAFTAESAPDAALILPMVLKHLTPPFVAMLGLGAVAAAVMSSADSSILSASSMFSWNVYRPLLRPQADTREIQRVIRAAIVCTGIAAATLALSVRSVYVLWYLCADLVYVILFPQLVMVLYSSTSNRFGALAGAVTGCVLRLGGGEQQLGIPMIIPYPMATEDGGTLFPFRTAAMLSSMLAIWLVSLSTGGRREATDALN